MLKRLLLAAMMIVVPLTAYADFTCRPDFVGIAYVGCRVVLPNGNYVTLSSSQATPYDCAWCDAIAKTYVSGLTGTGYCVTTPLAEAWKNYICEDNFALSWCAWGQAGFYEPCNDSSGGPVCESGNQTPTIHNDGAGSGGGDNESATAVAARQAGIPVVIDISLTGRRWGIQLMRMGPGIGTPVFSFPVEEAAPDEGWFVAVPESQVDPRTGKPYRRAGWRAHVNQVAALLHTMSGEKVERLAPALYREPPFTSLDPGAKRRQVDFLRSGEWTATRRHVIALKMGDRPNAVMFAGSYTLLEKAGRPATWSDIQEATAAGKISIRVIE